MTDKKTIYSPRVIYNPKTNETAIFAKDVIWGGIPSWFFYDGKECKTFHGKMKYPKGFIEVAHFPEGDL